MELENNLCKISFDEKVRLFSNDFLKCCHYIINFGQHRYIFTKKLFSTLISNSTLLEDFLDFHGAKNSKNWYFYREITAAVRHLSLAGYTQKHISNRLHFYELDKAEKFEKDGIITFEFLMSTLRNVAPVVMQEAKRLNIPLPEDRFLPEDFPGVTTSERLEYDIDDIDKTQQKKNIVMIASEFLRISNSFDEIKFYEPYGANELKTIVPEKVNEVKMRRYEMLVHNLQSSFDTYVIHGGFRLGNRKLKQLRSYFSIVFHLLQIIGRLLHFYERHLHDAGYKNIYKKVRERMASLIDSDMILDRTINSCLYHVCHFLEAGKELGREILNENVERSSITVRIPVKLGFHSRPSLLVAKIVQRYGGPVELCVGVDRFDASSVLDIQWAGGKIQKEKITEVTFEGDVRALRDLEVLAKENYGEDSMGKGVPLPKELKYLR